MADPSKLLFPNHKQSFIMNSALWISLCLFLVRRVATYFLVFTIMSWFPCLICSLYRSSLPDISNHSKNTYLISDHWVLHNNKMLRTSNFWTSLDICLVSVSRQKTELDWRFVWLSISSQMIACSLGGEAPYLAKTWNWPLTFSLTPVLSLSKQFCLNRGVSRNRSQMGQGKSWCGSRGGAHLSVPSLPPTPLSRPFT